MIDLRQLPQIITAIGGLGTAAFGLVDASKVLGGLGPNHIGFGAIEKAVKSLTPGPSANALSQVKIVATLEANWFNGTDLGSQKAIAKSLIKLNLSASSAPALAAVTGVDPTVLTTIATKIAAGTPLISTESDVYARFDLILTALLDETYQRSDDTYRNWTRTIAGIVAVILALAGGFMLNGLKPGGNFDWPNIGKSVLAGLLATPLEMKV